MNKLLARPRRAVKRKATTRRRRGLIAVNAMLGVLALNSGP